VTFAGIILGEQYIARWHCHAIRGNVGAGGQSRAAGQAPAQACIGSEAIVAGRLARGWRGAEGDRRVKFDLVRRRLPPPHSPTSAMQPAGQGSRATLVPGIWIMLLLV
jgi:hypothetical protein